MATRYTIRMSTGEIYAMLISVRSSTLGYKHYTAKIIVISNQSDLSLRDLSSIIDREWTQFTEMTSLSDAIKQATGYLNDHNCWGVVEHVHEGEPARGDLAKLWNALTHALEQVERQDAMILDLRRSMIEAECRVAELQKDLRAAQRDVILAAKLAGEAEADKVRVENYIQSVAKGQA